MAKKYEKTMDKVSRFQEELKMGCTTTKGVVRPLTQEEVAYRKGFCDTVNSAIQLKSGTEMGVLYPLYENQMAGVTSAFACMRGEKKYLKKQQEQKQLAKLKKKYPTSRYTGRSSKGNRKRK